MRLLRLEDHPGDRFGVALDPSRRRAKPGNVPYDITGYAGQTVVGRSQATRWTPPRWNGAPITVTTIIRPQPPGIAPVGWGGFVSRSLPVVGQRCLHDPRRASVCDQSSLNSIELTRWIGDVRKLGYVQGIESVEAHL